MITSSVGRRNWLTLVGIGAVLVCLTALGAPVLTTFGDEAFIGLAVACGALTIAATGIATTVPIRAGLAAIFVVGIALRLIVLPLEPFFSNDVFRYLWDGRVQGAGINPYRFVPADAALIMLRDDVIYPGMNRADYAVTIYPPVAQALFFLVTRFGESVVLMKAALVACEAVTIAVVIDLLRRLGRPATLVVAYVWHPLPVWEIANSGHIDSLMMGLMMAGLWLALCGWQLRGAAVITLAALAKPFAVLALPALWRPFDWRLPAVVVATVAAAYAPYMSVGADVLGFLTKGYLSEESIANGQGFWLLTIWRSAFGTRAYDVYAYLGLVLLLLGALTLRAAFRRERTAATILRDVYALLIAFLFLLSSNFPWYFLALVPFLALVGGAAGWALTIGAFMLNDAMYWDSQLDFTVRDAAFNVLVLLALFVEFAGRRQSVLSVEARA
jgi:alpha-1,6-mannosyltransferase